MHYNPTPGEHANDFIEKNFPRLCGYLSMNDGLSRLIIGALGSVVGDWWENEGYDCPETSMNHLCSSFQALIEEDYLGAQVIPEPLQSPPAITDPVIADVLRPVRDEDDWSRDKGIMDQLNRMAHDGLLPSQERARLARLYQLALVGWSYTFYRRGDSHENS